ncbi:MAG TPA: YihY/virulence factor BrkB family protein [Solirubrobacteraceae bacterium]|nr:YihY/virulence factor BrkB family protein [Solirubrobacteraceae bacterium]
MSSAKRSRPPSHFAQLVRRLDGAQQRHRRVAFAVALLRKYDDDRGGQLAALIAYWGFFSIFPLLLTFVTILGFVLHGDPSAQRAVLRSALSEYPIIGQELERNIHSLNGSPIALAIGIGGTLFAGLGVTGAIQNAFSEVWAVPRYRRPNFIAWRLRGLAQLAIFGTLLIASTLAAGYVTAQAPSGALATALAVLIAVAANIALFFLSFRVYTPAEIPTRELWPGVIVGALVWQALEHVGGVYVSDVIRHARATSGLFALVIGLLVWLYLGGRVAVIATEINAVRSRRLYPRSLRREQPLAADTRALSERARAEQLTAGERIVVDRHDPGG